MTPAQRKEAIRKATLKARRDWLRMTLKQEKELLAIYRQALLEIQDRILRYTKEGKVAPYRLKQLKANIQSETGKLRRSVVKQIKKDMRLSVNLGMKSQIDSIQPFIPAQFKVPVDYHSPAWAKINTKAMDFLLKFPVDGISVGENIWKHADDMYRGLVRTVNIGVAQGRSSADIARELRSYMLPERGWRHRPTMHPGTGTYKSGYRNALRVARTESNRAYGEGAVRYAKEKDWIKGLQWEETGDDLDEECANLHGKIFTPDDVPDMPHPNCGRVLIPVIDEDRLGLEGE